MSSRRKDLAGTDKVAVGVIEYTCGKVTGGQPYLPRTKASAMPDRSNRSRPKRAVSRDDVSRDQVSINYTRSCGRSSRGLSEEGLALTSGPQPACNSVFVVRGLSPLEGVRLGRDTGGRSALKPVLARTVRAERECVGV